MVAMTSKQDSMSEILPVSTNLRPCVLWKAPLILQQNWLGVEIDLARERQGHFTDGQKGRCVYWTQLWDPHQLLHCPVRAHGHSEWERGALHWDQWEELGPQAERRDAYLGAFLTEGLHGSSCDSKWQGLCLEFHLWENSSTPEAAAHGSNTKVHLFLSWRKACTTPSQATVYLLFCAWEEWRHPCRQQGCSVPTSTHPEEQASTSSLVNTATEITNKRYIN